MLPRPFQKHIHRKRKLLMMMDVQGMSGEVTDTSKSSTKTSHTMEPDVDSNREDTLGHRFPSPKPRSDLNEKNENQLHCPKRKPKMPHLNATIKNDASHCENKT